MGSDNGEKSCIPRRSTLAQTLFPSTDQKDENEHELAQRCRWWRLHFIMCSVVLFLGMMYNGGPRKYIRADALTVSYYGYGDAGWCDTAFVHVHSDKEIDQDAKVCCRKTPSNQAVKGLWFWGETVEDLLCQRRIKLPLGNTFHTFTTSWILPLVPELLRVLMLLLDQFQRPSSSSKPKQEPTRVNTSTTIFQLYLGPVLFYLMLMSYRAFVLYATFEKLEHAFFNTNETNEKECWYRYLLSQRHLSSKHPCPRQEFDFSDHAVLFFGQVLPVIILQLLRFRQDGRRARNTVGGSSHLWRLLRLVSWVILVYLYGLCLYGCFRTAALFHTVGESWCGYVIAVVCVHLPLYRYVVAAR